MTNVFWSNKPIECNRSCVSESIGKKYVASTRAPVPLQIQMINSFDTPSIDFLCRYYDNHHPDFVTVFTKELLEFLCGLKPIIVTLTTQDREGRTSICGIIVGRTIELTVYDKSDTFVNVVLMCVHPSYRKKRLSLLLIDELAKRAEELGLSMGMFMTGRSLPVESTTQTAIYYRLLNYDRLRDSGFVKSNIDSNDSNLFTPPGKPLYIYRLANPNDLAQLESLYRDYASRFSVSRIITNFDEILSNPCTRTYVTLKNNTIVDFVCIVFYSLRKNKEVRVARLILYTANNSSPHILVGDCLGLVKTECDIFMIDGCIQNNDVLLTDTNMKLNVHDMQFINGEKRNIYFYNWRLSPVSPSSWYVSVF